MRDGWWRFRFTRSRALVASLRLFPVRAPSRAGSILLLALWALVFLAALALAVGAHVSADLRLAEALGKRTRAYHLARAGVAYASATVAANTNTWDALTEDAWNGGASRFTGREDLPGGTFSLQYTVPSEGELGVPRDGVVGEERAININKASKKLLQGLFRLVGGVSRLEAQQISETIIEWRTPRDQVLTRKTEYDYYSTLDVPYQAHRGPFQSIYELRLVKGVDRALFEKVEPYITTYGSGRVNVNIASRDVLLCVAAARGVSSAQADGAVRELMDARPVERMEDVAKGLSDEGRRALTAMRHLLCVNSMCFSGTAVGRLGVESGRVPTRDTGEVTESRITFVVDTKGRELYWHEH